MLRDEEAFKEIGRVLRSGQSVSPAVDARVMAAVRALPRHRPLGLWARVNRPRPMMVNPASWALTAAAALMIAVLGGVGVSHGVFPVQAWMNRVKPAKLYSVPFTIVAPDARNVSVVGDFNGWDPNDAASQAHHKGGGLWTVTVPVAPGHHLFSFVVDSVWVTDPNAPRAPGNDVARANSAINVGADGQ